MMNFVRFMTGKKGRVARVLLGMGIIVLGQAFVSGPLSTVMTMVAFIPIAGGVLDYCLVGVALGYPFSGAKTRKILEEREV